MPAGRSGTSKTVATADALTVRGHVLDRQQTAAVKDGSVVETLPPLSLTVFRVR